MIESGFRGCHPFVIFFYYMCVGIIAMYLNHPLLLLIACLLLIAVNIAHGGGADVKKWLPVLAAMNSVLIVCNALLVSEGTTVLFFLFGRKVTLEATVFGIVLALSLSLLLLMFISFNAVLNGNKFLFVFSSLLPRTAFLIMLAVRFVPLLKKRLDEIADVQRIKGVSVASGTLQERCRNGMALLQILLTWSLEEAVETADSMKARGYGTGKRSPYIPYRMAVADYVWLLILVILLASCIACGAFGYGRIMIYPELGPWNLTFFDVALLVQITIMLSFPLLIEGGEQLRWKYVK